MTARTSAASKRSSADLAETTDAPSRRQAGDMRRKNILRAAAVVFFQQGYSATTVDAVIAQLGGSKRAIYQEFGSKEGLFNALLSEIADDASQLLSKPLDCVDLQEKLIEIGRRFMTLQMSPLMLGAYRVILAESQRFPTLAKHFYEKLPGFGASLLTEVLSTAKADNLISVADCSMASSHFTGMLRDNLHLQVVLGLRPPPPPHQIEEVVESVVHIFLNGISRRSA